MPNLCNCVVINNGGEFNRDSGWVKEYPDAELFRPSAAIRIAKKLNGQVVENYGNENQQVIADYRIMPVLMIRINCNTSKVATWKSFGTKLEKYNDVEWMEIGNQFLVPITPEWDGVTVLKYNFNLEAADPYQAWFNYVVETKLSGLSFEDEES